MKKLKNEQGVTILMALLLVLTAAVVSAVILSAALSAARRVNGDRTAQQNYLAVSSAAELVRDSIDQMRYTEITTTTYELDEKSGNYLQTGSSSTEKLPTGLMGDWLTARGTAAAPIPSPSRCRMKRSRRSRQAFP